MDDEFLFQNGHCLYLTTPFMCVFMQVCQIGLLCVGTLIIKKLTAVLLNVTDDVTSFIVYRCRKIVSRL